LVAAHKQAAAKVGAVEKDAAVDILMCGHREAAAILLEAWMRVTEGRPPGGERSR
jgi:hypothetical protein